MAARYWDKATVNALTIQCLFLWMLTSLKSFEKRIYIPLPGPEARKHMFELHVGSTPCQLTHKDYRLLADETDGYHRPLSVLPIYSIFVRYSGSDISILVRDALMQPVRKVISATHFKRVSLPDDPDAIKWTPCSPGDPDAVEKSWSEVESNELVEPPLTLKDFKKSLESVRPTVTAADIKKHDDWTKDSGMLL